VSTAVRPETPVEEVVARAWTIPTDAPEADGTTAWDATTMCVVTARCADVVGTGWTYGPAACAQLVNDQLGAVVAGLDAMDPTRAFGAMVAAVRNDTRTGVAGYAVSAVDVALWDLKARLLGLSLADLFGLVRDRVPVYGSGGVTTYDHEQLVAQLKGWTEGQGMTMVKIKIGESWGRAEDRDLQRIAEARQAVGPGVELFVDANGAYTLKQALRVARRSVEHDLRWFEEPVSSDHLHDLALLRGLVAPEVAAGEYSGDLFATRRLCESGAVDCLQVDATRCGGYTGWLRAAAVAAAYGLQVSAHCAPNLHAPVVGATTNARHLEWFHDHARIEGAVLDGALDPAGGSVEPDRSAPGHGYVFLPQRADELAGRSRG
jgi:L-alanine-DL-glutamate epimerase-like enolase superfamily enzyme